ncbi:hypothetical protein BLNAU_7301 [Blattamonas nauphoetae]|uniref:Histidine acid phosphatase n=1 Tax=Blattamonas nauphoetae TaxID=2049346 RepID=A0ABQ9Y1M6_9EUKA|nr:hypothetical protein BLNAU_7301 [Blattamonas nauphoetae]
MISLISSIIFTLQSELVSVHLVTRHGDRNPIQNYAFDPQAPTDGLLTKAGERRMWMIGHSIGERYRKEFSTAQQYSPAHYTLRSTHTNRTIESLNQLTNGFFTSLSGKDLSISPTILPTLDDYHIFTQKQDFIAFPSTTCKAGFVRMARQFSLPPFLEMVQEHEAIISKVQRELNISATGWNLVMLLDTLQILTEIGRHLPSSFTDADIKAIKFARDQLFSITVPLSDPAFCDAAASQFAEDLFFTHPQGIVKSSETNTSQTIHPHLYIYSSHDITHLSLGGCFGIDIMEYFPNYGSVLLVEEHRLDNESYFRFFYDYSPTTDGKLNLKEIHPHSKVTKHGISLSDLQHQWEHTHEAIVNGTWMSTICQGITSPFTMAVALKPVLVYSVLCAIFVIDLIIFYYCWRYCKKKQPTKEHQN